MKRRHFIVGAAGAGVLLVGAGAWLRPSDHGAPYDDYFARLNRELREHGPMRPVMLIDLDRLDHNVDVVMQSVARTGKHLRVVEKSLPSPQLLDYIAQRAGTRRMMSFHQPFLNHDAERFPDADLLLGKPLPVGSAQQFYEELRGPFDPTKQLQWLLDTPERLQQYLALAQGRNTRLRINIELDVGLHRGGVADHATLDRMLTIIGANPQHLEFAGFMGYDPSSAWACPRCWAPPRSFSPRS